MECFLWRWLLGQGHAAVYGKRDTHQVITRSRAHIDCRTGNVCRLPDTPRRYFGGYAFRIVPGKNIHFAGEGAWRNGINMYMFARQAFGHTPGQVNQACFARDVRIRFKIGVPDAVDRCNVDHLGWLFGTGGGA